MIAAFIMSHESCNFNKKQQQQQQQQQKPFIISCENIIIKKKSQPSQFLEVGFKIPLPERCILYHAVQFILTVNRCNETCTLKKVKKNEAEIMDNLYTSIYYGLTYKVDHLP